MSQETGQLIQAIGACILAVSLIAVLLRVIRLEKKVHWLEIRARTTKEPS